MDLNGELISIVSWQKDNLEFCQWLKAFYDQSGAHREGYDSLAVRAKGKGGKKYNDSMNKVATKSGSSNTVGRARKPTTTTYPAKPRVSTRPQRPIGETKTPLKASENKARPVHSNRTSKSTTSGSNSKANVDAKLVKKHAELESRVRELETTVCDIEKERDFYFGKLRSIELFLQIKQDKNWEGCDRENVVENLFKVLYATVDADVLVDEDGQVVPASKDTSYKGDISADLSDALGSNEVSNQLNDTLTSENAGTVE